MSSEADVQLNQSQFCDATAKGHAILSLPRLTPTAVTKCAGARVAFCISAVLTQACTCPDVNRGFSFNFSVRGNTRIQIYTNIGDNIKYRCQHTTIGTSTKMQMPLFKYRWKHTIQVHKHLNMCANIHIMQALTHTYMSNHIYINAYIKCRCRHENNVFLFSHFYPSLPPPPHLLSSRSVKIALIMMKVKLEPAPPCGCTVTLFYELVLSHFCDIMEKSDKLKCYTICPLLKQHKVLNDPLNGIVEPISFIKPISVVSQLARETWVDM